MGKPQETKIMSSIKKSGSITATKGLDGIVQKTLFLAHIFIIFPVFYHLKTEISFPKLPDLKCLKFHRHRL